MCAHSAGMHSVHSITLSHILSAGGYETNGLHPAASSVCIPLGYTTMTSYFKNSK